MTDQSTITPPPGFAPDATQQQPATMQIQQPATVQPATVQAPAAEQQPATVTAPATVQTQQPAPQTMQVQQPAPMMTAAAAPAPQAMVPMATQQPMVPMAQQQQPRPAAMAPRMEDLETSLDDKRLVTLAHFGKLNKDQMTVITPLLFNEEGGVRLLHFQKVFIEKTKKEFMAPVQDAAMMETIVNVFGQNAIKPTSMLLVFQYVTDPNGNIFPAVDPKTRQAMVDPESGQSVPAGQIVLWRPSREKIPPLKMIGGQQGLQNVDVLMRCSEDKFQKYDIMPANARVINQSPGYLKTVQADALRFWNNDVKKMIPPSITGQQLQMLINEYNQASQAPQAFGGAGGGMIDPFARGGVASPAVGMGGGMVSTGAPVFTGNPGGVSTDQFGDMIANASQGIRVG